MSDELKKMVGHLETQIANMLFDVLGSIVKVRADSIGLPLDVFLKLLEGQHEHTRVLEVGSGKGAVVSLTLGIRTDPDHVQEAVRVAKARAHGERGS